MTAHLVSSLQTFMNTPNNNLPALAREFRLALEARLGGSAEAEYRLPSKDEVAAVCRRYFDGIFPLYYANDGTPSSFAAKFIEELDSQLWQQIVYARRFEYNCCGKEVPVDLADTSGALLAALRTKLPKLAQLLATDLKAAMKNDPAASGYEEILLSYPGVEAITVQRLAHRIVPVESAVPAAHDDGNRTQPHGNRYSSGRDD